MNFFSLGFILVVGIIIIPVVLSYYNFFNRKKLAKELAVLRQKIAELEIKLGGAEPYLTQAGVSGEESELLTSVYDHLAASDEVTAQEQKALFADDGFVNNEYVDNECDVSRYAPNKYAEYGTWKGYNIDDEADKPQGECEQQPGAIKPPADLSADAALAGGMACQTDLPYCMQKEMPLESEVQADENNFTQKNSSSDLFTGDIFERLSSSAIGALANFFKQGNIWVTAGVVFIVLGTVFGYLYVASVYNIPGELKVSAGILAGFGIFYTGWRKKVVKPVFSYILQGGGIGVVYISVFAAAKIYDVMPIGVAFAVLAVLTATSGVLSVYQNSQPMAIFSSLIGFASPVLLSQGGGNYKVLFAYYILINAGIVYIASKKYWRYLNTLAFGITSCVGLLWGKSAYPYFELLYAELFLVAFFLIFTAINVLSSLKQPGKKIENAYAVTTSFTYAFCQLTLAGTSDFFYFKGLAMFSMGLFYLGLGYFLYRRYPDILKNLFMLYLALGTVFLNMSVFVTLSDNNAAALWAVEGVILLVLGLHQRNMYFSVIGNVLIYIAYFMSLRAYLNYYYAKDFIPLLLSSLAIPAVAFVYNRYQKNTTMHKEKAATYSTFLLVLSFIVLFTSLVIFLSNHPLYFNMYNACLVALCAGAFISVAGTVTGWEAAKLMVFAGVAPIMVYVFFTVLNAAFISRPYVREGLSLLPAVIFVSVQLALIIFNWLYLKKYGERKSSGNILSVWVVSHEKSLKKAFTVIIMPLALILIVPHLAYILIVTVTNTLENTHIPINHYGMVPYTFMFIKSAAAGSLSIMFYHYILCNFIFVVAAGSVCIYSMRKNLPKNSYFMDVSGWSVFIIVLITFSSLNYASLYNFPMDVAGLLILVFSVYWYTYMVRVNETFAKGKIRKAMLVLICVEAFWWVHVMLARLTVTAIGGEYSFLWLYASPAYQLEVAVLWAVTGFGCMLAGNKFAGRSLWLTGAVLLGFDIIKLMLIDLSRAQTLARIGSFIIVGILLVVIGYFVPLPTGGKGRK